jgi:tRNA(fMet)-specific endonuclease VapC
MNRVLLDTDTLSEVIKGLNVNVVSRAKEYVDAFGALSFSSASAYEVLVGLQSKQALGKIYRAEALFAQNEEIPPEAGDFRFAAKIVGALNRMGRPIGLFDPLIAACAIRRDYGVATGNTAHFEFIREAGFELHIENWRES